MPTTISIIKAKAKKKLSFGRHNFDMTFYSACMMCSFVIVMGGTLLLFRWTLLSILHPSVAYKPEYASLPLWTALPTLILLVATVPILCSAIWKYFARLLWRHDDD